MQVSLQLWPSSDLLRVPHAGVCFEVTMVRKLPIACQHSNISRGQWSSLSWSQLMETSGLNYLMLSFYILDSPTAQPHSFSLRYMTFLSVWLPILLPNPPGGESFSGIHSLDIYSWFLRSERVIKLSILTFYITGLRINPVSPVFILVGYSLLKPNLQKDFPFCYNVKWHYIVKHFP